MLIAFQDSNISRHDDPVQTWLHQHEAKLFDICQNAQCKIIRIKWAPEPLVVCDLANCCIECCKDPLHTGSHTGSSSHCYNFLRPASMWRRHSLYRQVSVSMLQCTERLQGMLDNMYFPRSLLIKSSAVGIFRRYTIHKCTVHCVG